MSRRGMWTGVSMARPVLGRVQWWGATSLNTQMVWFRLDYGTLRRLNRRSYSIIPGAKHTILVVASTQAQDDDNDYRSVMV